MPRLIDADAFAKFLKDVVKEQKYEDLKIDGLLTVADVIEAVISDLEGTSIVRFKHAPTIDAVPVVRCKDCKWKQGYECVRFADVRPYPDDFCSRAERKDNVEQSD